MQNLTCFPYRDHELEATAGILPMFRSLLGCFYMPIGNEYFQIIASNQYGWEHVSVSNHNRCPTFEEMVFVKEMFFRPGEVVFQLHPKKENYINFCETCLHLWRPSGINIPTPDISAVLSKYEFCSRKPIYRKGISNGIKYTAIYNPNWATWQNVCQIKQECFGDVEVLQYHVNRQQDLNEKKIILLWEYQNNFVLPAKELVL